MSDRRHRRWAWWAGRAAVAMAGLAALSLAVTVLLASRGLDDVADVVVLGDGETLVADVIVDLWMTGEPLGPERLTRVLAKHDAEGLRYVALVDPQDHHVLAQAGTAAIAAPLHLPGEVLRRGRRVRLFALVPPRSETRAASDPTSSPEGPPDLAPYPRPRVVVEFEPPVLQRLQAHVTRMSVVASIAALVLVAFAFAWSRTAARLSAVEEQAERERRLVALGQASAVIAHELRNPLAALKGNAQLLVEDLAEPARTKAARVVGGAERLERLTNMLLDFVRDGPLDLTEVTPAELVDRALGPLPKERVQVDLSGAPEVLSLDAERASLALRNLLENAVQATADESPVELRIRKDARDVVIEVRDHGAGLTRGVEGQIFDPFVTTKTRGTGLGLSIARRIAEQHHGTLTGETHGEGGAVFRLNLPLASKPMSP